MHKQEQKHTQSIKIMTDMNNIRKIKAKILRPKRKAKLRFQINTHIIIAVYMYFCLISLFQVSRV